MALSSYRFGRVLSLPIGETQAVSLLRKQEGAGSADTHPPPVMSTTPDTAEASHTEASSLSAVQNTNPSASAYCSARS